MTNHRPAVPRLLTISLCFGALAVAGCKIDSPLPAMQPAATAPAPQESVAAAPVPAAYTPPAAEQLYRMVAPIALYPDKLVAQILAAATYPEQITAAHSWLARNPGLKAGPLADAANQQPWDPSVKSLTAFRSVLDQLAGNLPWTESLGRAYYSDPDDVMNAIQVMRQRASSSGHLRNTGKLRVASAATPPNYAPAPSMQAVYAGPAVIQPPPQLITIEPAQPDVVYVPSYDPQVIYGAPVPVYPGYAYSPPVYVDPGYSRRELAVAGAITFGLGVVVGAALERHDWGWHAWNVNWGAPPRERDFVPAALPVIDRPAVVYNNSTYISRSTTVVNNVRNTNIYNNTVAVRAAPSNGFLPQPAGAQGPVPNFAMAPGFASAQQARMQDQQQQQQQQQQALLLQQQARQQQALLADRQAQQQAQVRQQQQVQEQALAHQQQQAQQQALARQQQQAQEQALARQQQQAQQQALARQQQQAQEQALAHQQQQAQQQALARQQQQAQEQALAHQQQQAQQQALARQQQQAQEQALARQQQQAQQQALAHQLQQAQNQAHQQQAQQEQIRRQQAEAAHQQQAIQQQLQRAQQHAMAAAAAASHRRPGEPQQQP